MSAQNYPNLFMTDYGKLTSLLPARATYFDFFHKVTMENLVIDSARLT